MSDKKRRQNFNYKVIRKVLEKTGGFCYYCKSPLPTNIQLFSPHGTVYMEIRQWHIDHLLPVSKGGKDNIENLVPACSSCNLKKHDKTVEDFLGNMA